MAYEVQQRFQCKNCKDTRDAEIAATGSSTITAYQFNDTNASAHLLANTTHTLFQVWVAVNVT